MIQYIVDGTIGVVADLNIGSRMVELISGSICFELVVSVSFYQMTTNLNSWIPMDRFDLSDEHKRFEVAFMKFEPRCKVGDAKSSLAVGDFGAEYVGVLDIKLLCFLNIM